jgi:fumarylacetoacetate (FAA) hydrolase family protein
MNLEARMCRLLAGFVAVALCASPVAHAQLDLDSLSDDQLRKDLMLELDDVDQLPDEQEGELDTEAELIDAFMDALQDSGDDEAESELDLADLQAEMEEAGTTVEDMVEQSVRKNFKAESDLGSKMGKTVGAITHDLVSSFWANVRKVTKAILPD